MNYSIYIPNQSYTIDPAFIVGFSYTTSLFTMFASSKVVLRDCTKTLYNYITSGMDVDVIFTDPTLSTSNNQSSASTYTNHMKVVAFKKIPAPQSNFTDIIEVELVSNWYFVNSTKMRAFGNPTSGKTVSEIVEEIFDGEEFKNLISLKSISTSQDTPHIRYQLNQKSQDFLISLLKYGRIDNLPIYLYTDAKGYVNLKGVSEFINSNTYTTVVPEAVMTDASLSSAVESYGNCLPLYSYRVNSSVSDVSSTLFTEYITLLHDQTTTTDVSSLSSTEKDNAQASTVTPEKLQYYSWDITPDDAISTSVREMFESAITAYSLEGTTSGLRTDFIYPGAYLRLLLPLTPINTATSGEINLGEGLYMVTDVMYSCEGTIEKTQFNSVQIKF